MAAPIRSVAIVGDGIAAWAAAAAFARRLGAMVTVVPVAGATLALSDRFGAMQLSARAFHESLGISETDLLARADAVVRLGMRFERWNGEGGYLQSFGDHGMPIGSAAFHQLWARATRDERHVMPFGAYSPAGALAETGHFAPPALDAASPMAGFDYALSVDPARYRTMLRSYATHVGARITASPLRAARILQGRIAGLETATATITADLYIDASGPDAILLAALPGGAERESWSGWLRCDGVATCTVPSAADIALADRAEARVDGWQLNAPGRLHTTLAQIYARGALSDDRAAHESGDHAESLTLAQGRRRAAWIGNCVAIGDAAVQIEPLEAPHLHLIHSAIERILALLPDTAFEPVEIARFNLEWGEEVDHVRDMLILHYALGRRSEPFWTAPLAPLPESLGRQLALFGERGRLPHRDFESFAPGSWYAVLLGQGIVPRRTDALADAVPPEQFEELATRYREAIAMAAAAAPPHRLWLERQVRQSAA